jgi:NADH-quinone oxidoreductase subunit L
VDPGTKTKIALLLFCGAAGKSAQFPLHVWLPDAMEGPTPVSALIHAATMVAAGVFMVARLYGIFSASPDAMHVIAYIGGFTAFFAATIALTQDDIKRVLAYSTLSQLGYMIMVLGAGGYSAGMFHLFTHAFFKALLFLGAGSVIHAMHTNNIWEMGGLHKKMPITSITFLIAALAISGIFPLAGFWSKDEILVILEHSGNKLLYYGAIITAFMTAFYMFRLWIVTFTGELKEHHAHESPLTMTVPLMILAFMSVVAGLAGMPWLKQNVFTFLYFNAPADVEFNLAMAVKSNIVAICGITLAVLIYGVKVIKAETMKKISGPLYVISKNKWFIDEIYLACINTVFITLTEAVKWFDRHIVDGAVNLVSFFTRWSGIKLRYTITGRVQNYALIIFSGLLIVILAFALYNPDALKIFGGR